MFWRATPMITFQNRYGWKFYSTASNESFDTRGRPIRTFLWYAAANLGRLNRLPQFIGIDPFIHPEYRKLGPLDPEDLRGRSSHLPEVSGNDADHNARVVGIIFWPETQT